MSVRLPMVIAKLGGVKSAAAFWRVSSRMKAISHAAPQVARTIDLYGRAENSRLILWRRAVQVMPVSAFERAGRWIRSGHYVIDYKGDAIVVHCANRADGRVSIQFMHDEWLIYAVDRSTIEPRLLGKMVVSEEQQAAVCEGRRLSNYFADEEQNRGSWIGGRCRSVLRNDT
jgi:hypothetical protein